MGLGNSYRHGLCRLSITMVRNEGLPPTYSVFNGDLKARLRTQCTDQTLIQPTKDGLRIQPSFAYAENNVMSGAEAEA